MFNVNFTSNSKSGHRRNASMLSFKLLLLSLLIVALVVFPFANFAYADGPKHLAFTSDVHGYIDNLENWLRIIKNDGVYPLDRMIFGGDYPTWGQESTSWNRAQECVQVVKDIYGSETPVVLVRGNHDTREGVNESYSRGLVYNGDDYAVYAIYSADYLPNDRLGSYKFYNDEIAALGAELNKIAGSKPVFVTSHCPIHYFKNRTTSDAKKLLDVLNKHENVIFMWGHNHTEGDPYYGQVMTKGFNIKTTSSDPGTDINFTYLSYGSMMSQDNIEDFGLVAELFQSEGGTIINFTYKGKDGSNRAEKSIEIETYTQPEVDPIDSAVVSGVVTPVAGDTPSTNASVSASRYSVESVSWLPASSTFGYDTAYTVVVVLKPESGNKFTAETTATVNGNNAICDLKGNGSLSVSFTFPKTSSPSGTLYQRVNYFENNGTYLIVGETDNKNYALTSNVASSSYLAASEITIEGEYVPASAVLDAMRWTAEKDGDYTYLKNGGYLHRVSGGDNISASETVKDQGKGGWLYNASDAMLYTISTNPQAPDNQLFFLDYSSSNNYYRIAYDTDHTRIKLYKLVGETQGTSVTGVNLNKSSLELRVGESEDLTAIVLPTDAGNKSVSWSSSNNSVATVNANGRVEANSTGSATITVTTVDGNFKANAFVTVTAKIDPVVTVTGVNLNESSLELKVGESESLIATVFPNDASNKSVSWSSSNNSVATVNASGRVEANSTGSATITVTTADGDFKANAVVTVTAKVDPDTPVTGVSLNKASLDLEVNEKETLIAAVTPANADNKDVTWVSTSPTVVSVDSKGEVEAKAAGSTTITVTTVDGGFKAQTVVNVTAKDEPVAPVTGVSLNKTILELEVGQSEILEATVLPTNAINKNVRWHSSDSSIASVDDSGRVEAIAEGSTIIVVVTVEGGFAASTNISVIGEVITISKWVQDGEIWYYYGSDGELVKGWLQTGGRWYYLDPTTGAMQVGWKNVQGKWYYLNPNSGAMRVGWVQTGGKWYYLSPSSGAMRVGWLKYDGEWYYLSPSNGSMQTGWVKSGSKWYYLEANGAMATSKWINGNYYVGIDGAMYISSWTPDGYYVDENGKWVKERTP